MSWPDCSRTKSTAIPAKSIISGLGLWLDEGDDGDEAEADVLEDEGDDDGDDDDDVGIADVIVIVSKTIPLIVAVCRRSSRDARSASVVGVGRIDEAETVAERGIPIAAF